MELTAKSTALCRILLSNGTAPPYACQRSIKAANGHPVAAPNSATLDGIPQTVVRNFLYDGSELSTLPRVSTKSKRSWSNDYVNIR